MEHVDVFLLVLVLAAAAANSQISSFSDDNEGGYSLIHLKKIAHPNHTLVYAELSTEDKEQYARCLRFPKELQTIASLSAYMCHSHTQSHGFVLDVPSAIGLQRDIAVILAPPYTNMMEDVLQSVYNGVSKEDYISDLNSYGAFGVRLSVSSDTFIYLPPAEVTDDVEIVSEQMEEFEYPKVYVKHLLTPWEDFHPDLYPQQDEQQQILHCFSTGAVSDETFEDRVTYNCFVPDLAVLVRLGLPGTITQPVIDAVIAPHYWTMVNEVVNNTYTGVSQLLYIQDLINHNGVEVTVVTQTQECYLPPAVFEKDIENHTSNSEQLNNKTSEDASVIFELPEPEVSDYKVLHLEDTLDPTTTDSGYNTTQQVAWCFKQQPRCPLSHKLSTFTCTFPHESYQMLLDIPDNTAPNNTVIGVVLHAAFCDLIKKAVLGRFAGISRHDYINGCEQRGGYGVRVEDDDGGIRYLPVAVPSEVVDYTGPDNIAKVYNTYQIIVDGRAPEDDTEDWYSGRCYNDMRSYDTVYQSYICMQPTELLYYKLSVPKALNPHNIIDMALSGTVRNIALAALKHGSYKGVDLMFFLKDLVKANFVILLDNENQTFTLTVSLPPPQLADDKLYFAIIHLREQVDNTTVLIPHTDDREVFRCLKEVPQQIYVCHHHTLPVEIQLDVPTDISLPEKTDLVVAQHYWAMIQDAVNGTFKGIPTETYLEHLAKTRSVGVKVNSQQGLVALPHAKVDITFEEVSRFDKEVVEQPKKVYFGHVATSSSETSSSSSEDAAEREFHCFHTTQLPEWASYTCYHHETPIKLHMDIPSRFTSDRTIDIVLAPKYWEMVYNAWFGVERGISEEEYVHQLVHNHAIGLAVHRPGITQKPLYVAAAQPEQLYVYSMLQCLKEL